MDIVQHLWLDENAKVSTLITPISCFSIIQPLEMKIIVAPTIFKNCSICVPILVGLHFNYFLVEEDIFVLLLGFVLHINVLESNHTISISSEHSKLDTANCSCLQATIMWIVHKLVIITEWMLCISVSPTVSATTCWLFPCYEI